MTKISPDNATLKQLSYWEDIVFSSQEAFEREFCNGYELLGIWFNSETVKLWYMAPEGKHYSDTCTLKTFLEFIKKQ